MDMTAPACHDDEHQRLHGQEDDGIAPAKSAPQVCGIEHALAQHVTQVGAEQRLQQMPGELHTTRSLHAEIVKSLWILRATVHAVMLPVQRSEAPDIDAG